MTQLWRFLESLLAEAKDAAYYRDQLFRLVQRRHGQDAADEMMQRMQVLSPQAFQQYVATHFVSDEIDEITRNMVNAALHRHPERARGIRPTQSRSTDKGSGAAEPIPPRPTPSRSPSPLSGAPRTVLAPGEKPSHAVGAGPLHRPKEPEFMRPGITSGPKTSAGVVAQVHDPEKETPSGIVAAQRRVDQLYRDGDRAGALKLSRQLGVPPPEERFHYDRQGQVVRDAAGRPRIVTWSPDRVFKWRKEDEQHLPVEPGAERATSMRGAEPRQAPEPISRTDLIKHGLAKRMTAPTPERERRGPDRPPSFDGEVWQPHGSEGEERTMRMDPIIGNWVFGKRQVDPSKTGAKWVGYRGKWYTPSEYAAIRARDAGVELRKGNAPWKAWQHPPRRGAHAGPTPASPPKSPAQVRAERPPQEPEDEFSDEPTDPGVPSFDDDEE